MNVKYVHIMRINWYNYNSAWKEGSAFTDIRVCVAHATLQLAENYKASIKDLGLESAQMFFEQNEYGIDVIARQAGRDDRVVGTAEIHHIPLVGSGDS